MSDSADVKAWLDALDDPQRDQAVWLADAVRDELGGVGSDIKWKRLTFALEGDWHHWLCAVAASKAGVRLVFHKGALLDDPCGLLRGDAAYTRDITYADAEANRDALAALLHDATDKRTEMLP